MTISLDKKQARQIEHIVASGAYNNAKEVINTALELLKQHDRKKEWLEQELAKGERDIAEGRTSAVDLDKILDEAINGLEK